MANTKRVDEIVQKLVDILDGAKDTFTPKVQAVYYGDQDKVPAYPAIAVSGGQKRRDIIALHKFEVVLRATIFVYHGEVQSSEITNKQVDVLSEQVEDLLHGNLTMDGLVVNGFITRNDPGVSLRSDVMIRTSRMLWEAKSRETF